MKQFLRTILFFSATLLISCVPKQSSDKANLSEQVNSTPMFGQEANDDDIAIKKAKEAIRLMDEDNIDEALTLLEEAHELAPQNIDITYEIALANYLKKDYTTSIGILKELTAMDNANPRFFQLLGNSYSMNNDRKAAIATYEDGIKRFPNCGFLYLERGTMEMFVENYEEALSFYEKGIEVDPKFPSNYYYVSKLCIGSSDIVKGLIYGEIFLNLERNSIRSAEISRQLFDTYKDRIQFDSDGKASVNFGSASFTDIFAQTLNPDIKPIVDIYDATMRLSLTSENKIDISTLDRIRRNFVKHYFENKHDEEYPVDIFNYQKEMLSSGHMEAYNYWLLRYADFDKYEKWIEDNKEKWDSFEKWIQNSSYTDFFSSIYERN